ncbi:hypothetical protein LCGC14_1450080 [marine sediment metagenome]|uniref:Uncharacterized protein n=1 Tax=marine sediment metagenome TaxID=412755 RepID=A0A0F9K4D8_9ZZZZ
MVIEENDHVLVIWFQSYNESDYMGALVREGGPDGDLVLRYRFRYYAPSEQFNPFDENDRKNWYEARLTCSEAEAIEKTDRIVEEMAIAREKGWGDLHVNDRIFVNGGGDAVQKALSKMPWCHMKFEEAKP